MDSMAAVHQGREECTDWCSLGLPLCRRGSSSVGTSPDTSLYTARGGKGGRKKEEGGGRDGARMRSKHGVMLVNTKQTKKNKADDSVYVRLACPPPVCPSCLVVTYTLRCCILQEDG